MSDVTKPGREMYERFKALGDMNGKTLTQIIAAVGSPTSISSAADNQQLIQWLATGFHTAILFDDQERFVGITHQFGNFEAAPAGCLGVVIFLIASGAGIGSIIVRHFL